MASGRDWPGLLMAFSGPKMDWGRQRVTEVTIKTGRRRKLGRDNRKVGGGGRMKAWDLEVPGLEPEAILHRKFPTHSPCILNEVGDHQLSSRSEPIGTFSPRQTYLNALYAVWLVSGRREKDKIERLEICSRGLEGERMSWGD